MMSSDAVAGLLHQARFAALLVALLRDVLGQTLVRRPTTKSSPASGTPDRPSTCTGIDGPASVDLLARSRRTAHARGRTRLPQTRKSPFFERAGCCTSTVATGPRPLSRLGLDDHAAGAAIDARPAVPSTSDWSEIASSSSSTPMPVFAGHLHDLRCRHPTSSARLRAAAVPA